MKVQRLNLLPELKLCQIQVLANFQKQSIKRMIRVHKMILKELFTQHQHLERYRVTPNGESFLLFDSGVGDNSSIIIFAIPKMFSILRDSQRWLSCLDASSTFSEYY